MSVPKVGRRTLAGLAVLAILAAGAVTSPTYAFEYARALADDPILFGLFVGVLYLVRPAIAWPTTLVSVLVGWGYGFPVGVPVALGGVVLSTLPPFAAARWFGRGGAFPRVSEIGRRYFETAGDARGIAAARLAPIPADAVTCAAGLGEVRVRGLIAGTLVGELPWTVAAVLVGGSLEKLSTGGLGSVGLPLAVATAVAAGLLLLGPVYTAFTEAESTPSLGLGDG